MGFLNKAKNAVKHFHDTWVAPESEPDLPEGEMYIKTPDGKTVITATLNNSADAQKIKEIVNILFPDVVSDRALSADEYLSLGRTE